MTTQEQNKVRQALKYFLTNATTEQKKEALALLEKDCESDVTLKEYEILCIYNKCKQL